MTISNEELLVLVEDLASRVAYLEDIIERMRSMQHPSIPECEEIKEHIQKTGASPILNHEESYLMIWGREQIEGLAEAR